MSTQTNNPHTVLPQLLNAEETLEAIFPSPQSRPSVRWFRDFRARVQIPEVRLGHRKIYYDPEKVREAITAAAGGPGLNDKISPRSERPL